MLEFLKSPNKIMYFVIACLSASPFSCSRQTAQGERLKARSEIRFWEVSLPEDSTLDTRHPLMPFMKAAAAKELPLTLQRDLIRALSPVSVKESDRAYFMDEDGGGTIYMPAISSVASWSRSEWATFYGLLFRAWFHAVAGSDSRYRPLLRKFHSNEYLIYYRKANPSNPWLAQEDAFADTISSVLFVMSPTSMNGQVSYPELHDLDYEIDRTVAPVSRSDLPGYTPEADSTYPALDEYRSLFKILTAVSLD